MNSREIRRHADNFHLKSDPEYSSYLENMQKPFMLTQALNQQDTVNRVPTLKIKADFFQSLYLILHHPLLLCYLYWMIATWQHFVSTHLR